MAWGTRGNLAVVVVLVAPGVLAGCSGGNFFAEREPWRLEAEVQCISSGAVREGAGVVRIEAIRGPGICGADFPLKVSSLGESPALGFADELRPPAAIPGVSNSTPARWPLGRSDTTTRRPRYESDIVTNDPDARDSKRRSARPSCASATRAPCSTWSRRWRSWIRCRNRGNAPRR